MNQQEALNIAREKGFVFDSAKGFISDETMNQIVADSAAMLTTPNAGVPEVLTSYVDTKVIEILTAPTNAREIFGEVKMGDWTTDTAIFKTVEETGSTTPYADYNLGLNADVNINFPTRQNYVFETTIRFGERERAVMAKGLIDLASRKQIAAASVINRDANTFALYGVAGKEIYGLLNDPNLPAAITPTSVAGSTLWADKGAINIYNDILKLAAELFTNSQGRINAATPLTLAVPPNVNVYLGTASEYGVTVMDMLNKYFSSLKIVVLPELAAATGNNVMLIAKSVDGSPVGEIGFSEKMRAMELVRQASWMEQKFVAGTYGTIIYRPFAIATLAGV